MRGWIRGRCRNCLTTAQSEGRLLLALERRCLASDRMVAATRVCKLKNIITVCYNGSQSFSNCLANARNSNERRRKRISTFSFSLLRLSWVEHWLDRKGLFSSILILVFPLFQTRASSRSRIDLTVSESRVSLWNCAYIYIYGSARSTLFLGRKKKERKKKKKKRKEVSRKRTFTVSSARGGRGKISLRSFLVTFTYCIDRLDRTGARQFHTIAKRSRCNASSHCSSTPKVSSISILFITWKPRPGLCKRVN